MSADVQPSPLAPTVAPIRASWIAWPVLSHGILLAAVLLTLTVVMPKFEDIFKSFDMALPLLTQLVMAAALLAQKWALLILPAAGGALALDVLLYTYLRRRGLNVAARLWWWGVTLVALFVAVIIALGLILPRIPLLTNVSNSASGG